MTGREQAKLLGLFFWIYVGLQIVLVGGFAFIYLFIFGAVITQMPHRPNEPNPEFILPFIIVVVAIIFFALLLFSVPKIVAGYGLRNGRSWARIWAIVASCFSVLSFPIGTALGVWGLIFIFGDEGKRYFEELEYGRLGAQTGPPPPPPNNWQ